MRPGQQISRPGGYTPSVGIILAMNIGIKFTERVDIFSCGTTHDQAIAQVTQNRLFFGEHDESCRAIAWKRAVMPRTR
jgi:hypothetical protein